jgi:hypothetical protein
MRRAILLSMMVLAVPAVSACNFGGDEGPCAQYHAWYEGGQKGDYQKGIDMFILRDKCYQEGGNPATGEDK